MEWYEILTNFISNFGFPIAVCIYLFWDRNKEREQHQAEMQQLREAHKQETQALTTAINNNTMALEKLVIKMGVE